MTQQTATATGARGSRKRTTAAPPPPPVEQPTIETVTENPPAAAPRTALRMPDHAPATAAREADHEAAHESPRVRTRSRRSTVNEDMFYIPVEEIPEGSSYEWKRYSVNGLEDPFYLAQMREQGWEPVDPKRHPNWVPPDYKSPTIIKGGQILMERPIELTQEARQEQRQLARKQTIEAEQRLGMTPKDTMTRQYKGVEPQIHKEIGRMIPIEE